MTDRAKFLENLQVLEADLQEKIASKQGSTAHADETAVDQIANEWQPLLEAIEELVGKVKGDIEKYPVSNDQHSDPRDRRDRMDGFVIKAAESIYQSTPNSHYVLGRIFECLLIAEGELDQS